MNSILVDLYFESDCYEDATIELETVGGIVLYRSEQNKASLIFIAGKSFIRRRVS